MKGNRLLYFGYTKSQIKHIVIYAVSMASLVFLLKWLQWKYLITDHSLDVYITLIALFFTVLGIWIATQLSARKTETGADNQRYVLDEAELGKMNLSAREQEVLELLVKGRTNAEIADRLFLSVSTVKTHVSNLFIKMDVRNRIQAVEKANRLKIRSKTT